MGISIGPRMVARGNGVEAAVFAPPFRLLAAGYANMESKLKRCREKAPAEEHLADRELKQKIQSVDRRRAKFYELYTGSPWRNMENFDVCVNTTHVSVRAWVPFLAKSGGVGEIGQRGSNHLSGTAFQAASLPFKMACALSPNWENRRPG